MIMRDAKPTLRIGDAIVASISLKARIARFLASLTTPEKGFEGQIDAHRHVLQDLGMHVSKGRAFFFQDRIRPLLLEARERNPISLIGCFAHFQQMIIEKATLFKMSIKRSLLFFRRIDPILKVLKHVASMCFKQTGVKKRPMCPIAPPQGRAIHPRLSKAGLSGPFSVNERTWLAV